MLLIAERIQAGPQCQRATELAQLNVTKQLVQVHFTGRTCEVKLQAALAANNFPSEEIAD